MIGAGGDFASFNLFAYCLNNPVNRTDEGGTLSWGAKILIGSAVILALAIVTVATAGTGTALACAAAGALEGAVTGAAVGAVSGAATGAITHRITTGSWEGAGQAALEGAADGYMLGSITGAITGGMNSNYCFVAGTLVQTKDGTKPIEEIEAGDQVWAWDEETGEVALKPVLETYINETEELIHVYVNGKEIVSTPGHPFYSPVKGWTDAVHLRAGDILVLVNGEYVVVEKVQHELLEAPINVYNFNVDGFHTYYVSSIGVLVHNSCNHGSKWAKERRSFWKQTAKTAEIDVNYGAYTATEENIARMAKGLAPKGWDGFSVQLHHWSGIMQDFYDYSPVSRTLHQIIHSLS